MSTTRRRFLGGLLGAAAAWPVASMLGSRARALGGRAERVIVFYFPDGIGGRSQDGETGLFDARSEGGRVVLSEILQPLGSIASECTFVNGLSMGGADEGSHPGGAKKLLTATDGGNHESIDQLLARTAGSTAPFRHLYLGVQATVSGASGDKHISYPSAGLTTAPEDDPVRAFSRVFGSGTTPVPGLDPRAADRSVLDTALADLDELRGRLGTAERVRLDLHAEALREVERRLAVTGMAMGSCEMPAIDLPSIPASELFDPARFDALLRGQIDVMVTAMSCGLTRVGVIQCSHHTSELVMSRIPETEMYDPGYDMRSHQASHYGSRHDRTNRLFTSFLAQRRYFVDRFRMLLEELDARPEGEGTMLDHSIVLLCTEVSDGNTHSHQEMPFVIGGRAGGCITPDRVLAHPGRRHGELHVAIANAMGEGITRFGDSAYEALPGLLSP